MRRNESSTPVVENGCGWGLQRLFEHYAGKVRMPRGEFDGEVCAEILAGKDNCARGNVAGSCEISESRVSVFVPPDFAGMSKMALSVSAIVEGEHVEARCVQPGHGIHRVAKVAVCAVEINDRITGCRCGGHPPAA